MSKGNPKNFDEHKFKELRIALPKMKLVESQNKPSTSSSEMQEDINAITGELAEKKLLECDDSKSPKKNKNVVPSGNLKIKIRKSKIKPSLPEGKEKEPQKSAKSSGEDAKKRSTSKEKKPKAEPDKSPNKTKEKGNTPKDKTKEKRVSSNQKEKKTPKKTAEDSHEFKDVKDLLREDPTLPPGWRRIIKGKHVGTELKPVVCIASPEGRKFYFKARLKDYLEKNKSNLTVDDFYFGLYKRSEKDQVESKSASSVGKKAESKKSQKQKRSESVVKERESKKIRLDSGSGSKKAQSSKSVAWEKEKSSDSSDEGDYEAGDKNLLLEDPDLPEGWVRQVLVKNDADGHNKIQVWIISPEGKRFQRKFLLNKYLQKTKSTLDIDQFYFGIYPRRDEEGTAPADQPSKEPSKQEGKTKQLKKKGQKSEGSKKGRKEGDKTDGISESLKNTTISSTLSKSNGSGDEPMLEDPNLPPGWRRFIKVRSAGESAGRMEVIISSPDGKRHRSKAGLEQYIKQKGLDLNADDFDFTVFGKNSKRYSTGPAASATSKQKSEKSPSKKRGSASHTPSSASRNVTASSTPEDTQTREGAMINYVSALMLNCGLRDLRSERRLRIPKQEQEKVLKNYLDSISAEKVDEENEESEIPTSWVKTLAHCRSDFGKLEDDAAETIASLTKNFVVRLAQDALKQSKDESKLEYNDIAEVVDKSESLTPLKTLIPKKITYKEYLKLNRPKKFTSFT